MDDEEEGHVLTWCCQTLQWILTTFHRHAKLEESFNSMCSMVRLVQCGRSYSSVTPLSLVEFLSVAFSCIHVGPKVC